MALRFADFVFDPEGRRLRRGEEEIRLSPRTFRLLEVLIEARPRAVPKRELMNLIWPDAVVEESNLKTTVSELRAALDDAVDTKLIRTVQRYGYAFSGEVATGMADSLLPGSADTSDTPANFRSQFSIRRGWSWAAAIALLLVLAGAGWLAFGRRQARTPPPQAAAQSTGTPIVIFPFTIRGRADLAYLGEGMLDLLGRKLDGVGDLHTVEAKIVLDHLKHENTTSVDRETGSALSTRFGARLFVIGNVIEVGGRLRAEASLYDSSGKLQTTAEASGNSEGQLFAMVDELGGKLLASQQLKEELRLGRVAAETTSSLEALKHFLEGERYYRGLRRSMEFRRAEEHFDAAVRLDPSFALAWYRLSWAQIGVGKPEESFESNQKATRLSSRLSLRDRRQLEFQDAWIRGNADQAEQLERMATQSYPDDLEAWSNLGETLFHMNAMRGRLPTESRPAFERVLQLNPHDSWALLHLMDMATEKGDLKEIEALTRRSVEAAGASRYMHLARRFFSDQRASVVDESRDDDELGYALSWSLQSADFVSAERILQRFEKSPSRAYALTQGAMIDVGRGRWKSGKERLSRAAAVDSARALAVRSLLTATPFLPAKDDELRQVLVSLNDWVQPGDQETNWAAEESRRLPRLRHYLIALTASRLRNRPLIERSFAELQKNPPPVGSPTSDFELVAAGLLAQVDGDAGIALRFIEKARGGSSGSVYRNYPFNNYLHAELLLANGRAEEALRWFDSMIPVYGPEQFAFSAVARLRSAEIYERAGKAPEAIRDYSAFVELWKDCDPELRPVVETARARLQILIGDARRDRTAVTSP